MSELSFKYSPESPEDRIMGLELEAGILPRVQGTSTNASTILREATIGSSSEGRFYYNGLGDMFGAGRFWAKSGGGFYSDGNKVEGYTAEGPGVLAACLAVKAMELDFAGIAETAMKEQGLGDFVSTTTEFRQNYRSTAGAHESYCLDRNSFYRVVNDDALALFFALRPIISGVGGYSIDSELPVIAPRSLFIQKTRGHSTTRLNDYDNMEEFTERSLINTRDESLADAGRFARLHVIGGEHNVLILATGIKLLLTSLAIQASQDRILSGWYEKYKVPATELPGLTQAWSQRTAGWAIPISNSRGTHNVYPATQALKELYDLLFEVYGPKLSQSGQFIMSCLKQQLTLLDTLKHKKHASIQDLEELSKFSDWARKIYLTELFVSQEPENSRQLWRVAHSRDYHRMGMPGREKGSNRESNLVPFEDAIQGLDAYISASDIEDHQRECLFKNRSGLRADFVRELTRENPVMFALTREDRTVKIDFEAIETVGRLTYSGRVIVRTPDPYEMIRERWHRERIRSALLSSNE